MTRAQLALKTPGFQLRDLRLLDAVRLADFIRDPRFSFPLLTGAAGPIAERRPLIRAFHYVGVCVIANCFGPLLFGTRRHWIMALTDSRDHICGVVMIDALLRTPPQPDVPVRGETWLKRPERRVPLERGDGEIGFFLHPDLWGRGLAFQGVVCLCTALAAMREVDGSPLLRRIWAETGEDNLPARRLLERLGLEERPAYRLAASDRYRRDGSQITLLHYAQPASDEASEPQCPVLARLAALEP